MSENVTEPNSVRSIDLLVVDTPENLHAARRYMNPIKGKELVNVRFKNVYRNEPGVSESGFGYHFVFDRAKGVMGYDWLQGSPWTPTSISSFDHKTAVELKKKVSELIRIGSGSDYFVKDFSGPDIVREILGCSLMTGLTMNAFSFSLRTVTYESQVSEALKKLDSVDAVITGLFFREREEPINDRYQTYLDSIKNSQSKGLLSSCDAKRRCWNIQDSIKILDGTPVGNLRLEFAYGCLVIMGTKKPAVLLAHNLFPHASNYCGDFAKRFSESMDGIVCLAPLVDKGLISEKVGLGFGQELSYLSSDVFPWTRALGRVVEQYSMQNNVN